MPTKTMISWNFSEAELNHGRGWAVQHESLARYTGLAIYTLEPIRHAFGDVPVTVLSAERTLEHNQGGRSSSCHLPPHMRMDSGTRKLIGARDPNALPELKQLHSAAADIRIHGVNPEVIFWVVLAAMSHGLDTNPPTRAKLPRGGVFYYQDSQFVHVDNRGYIARETKLTPKGSITGLSNSDKEMYLEAIARLTGLSSQT